MKYTHWMLKKARRRERMRTKNRKQVVAGNYKSTFINNYVKCKETKHSNENRT